MSLVLDFFLGHSLPRISDFHNGCTKFQDLPQIRPGLSYGKSSYVQKCIKVQPLPKALTLELTDHAELHSFREECAVCSSYSDENPLLG